MLSLPLDRGMNSTIVSRFDAIIQAHSRDQLAFLVGHFTTNMVNATYR